MPSDRTFQVVRLRSQDRNYVGLQQGLVNDSLVRLQPQGVRLFGLWYGLFGLRSNELLMVTSWPQSITNTQAALAAVLPPQSQVVELSELLPTVRPEDDQQRTRSGVYVFRYFDVLNKSVDEIAALSKEAWETFETSDAYASEPQALFCQRDRSKERGLMLLLTWYDDLTSWQKSRQPPAQAANNFRRRAELTFGTIAYATRLVGT